MHSRVRRHVPEQILRRFGALLILLLLVGPLASVQPAPVAAQDAEPPDELTEIWTFEGSDFFENNPAVNDGVVFASTADSIVHAVGGETGEALWQAETGYVTRPYMHLAGGVLYTLSADDTTLTALDVSPEGGEERWSVDLPGPLEALRTPVTADGMILVLVDLGGSETGEVLALSTEDGSEQWSFDVSEFLYGVGLLYADGVVVVGMEEGLTGLDAATGDELWQIDLDPTSVMLIAGDGALYGAVRESDELFALDIASGDERWNVSAPTEFNQPVAYGNGLFLIDQPLDVDGEQVRGILALDAETGDERYTIASLVGEVSAVTVHGGLVYLAADETVGMDGALEVYAGDDGSLLARTIVTAKGIAVDPETGVIYATTRGPDGDLLRAYEAMTSATGEGEGDGGDAATAGDMPLDLAAMALTPWDLADAGLDNYGHGFSQMIFLDTFVTNVAADRGSDEDEVRELLEDAGFLRAYYAYFYSPAGNEDVNQTVVSYIFEFADDDGAADAWEFLEDESDKDDAEDIDGFDDFGDASEATLSPGEDSATGDPFIQLDVSARLGNLHTGVMIVDWNNEDLDEDQAAELIEYAIEQVEHGLEAEQPALSNMVPRLSGDPVAGYYDAYLLRDGEAIWFFDETPEVADAFVDDAEATGKLGEYRVWKYIPLSESDENATVWTFQTLIQFEDDDAAEDWLINHRDVAERDESYTDIETEEIDVADGGYTITARTVDADFYVGGIAFRIGSHVALIDLLGPVAPTDEAVAAITDAQLACLEDEGCLEPIGIPADLEDYLADAGEGAAPDDEETPSADDTPEAGDTPEADETPEEEETEQADGGPVIYEGELYPFAVEYNANDWRIVPEDDPADDDDEWIQFLNDVSTVWMVATQDFAADELGDCVDHYRVELGWEDAWELEPLDELTEDDERAYASYTLVDVLFGLTGYLSIECQPIDSDTVLMITHFAGTDAEGEIPDDEIAAVEELTNGIVIYEGD